MNVADAFRERMIFEASHDPRIAEIAEYTAPNLLNEDIEADVTAEFAKLAGPILREYCLVDRLDSDKVLVSFLAERIKGQQNGEA